MNDTIKALVAEWVEATRTHGDLYFGRRKPVGEEGRDAALERTRRAASVAQERLREALLAETPGWKDGDTCYVPAPFAFQNKRIEVHCLTVSMHVDLTEDGGARLVTYRDADDELECYTLDEIYRTPVEAANAMRAAMRAALADDSLALVDNTKGGDK